MSDVSDDDLLTTSEAARLTPFKPETFRTWKLSWREGGARRGPRPRKIEGRVFYRRRDVLDWMAGQHGRSGAAAG